MTRRPFVPTAEQKEVIGFGGSAFVTACPGAGKTAVLVARARLMLRQETAGKAVAFLSFTNAAVSELQSRLFLNGVAAEPVFPNFIGTFDSFLWQFFIAPFGIPGSIEKPRMVPDKEKRVVIPFNGATPLPLHSFERSTGAIKPAKAKENGYDTAVKPPSQVKAYETAAAKLRALFLGRGELDYQDVRDIAKQRCSDAAFSKHLLGALSGRFHEVIVDEAQDCNPEDLATIEWLRSGGIAVKVICDPDQAIYSFRGGISDELATYRTKFAPSEQLPISGNFRSSQNICNATVGLRAPAASAIADTALGEFKDENLPVYVCSYKGKVTDAIAKKFVELLDKHQLRVADSRVLAATKASWCNALGLPYDEDSQHATLRLARAVCAFHFSFEHGNVRAALDDVHAACLRIQGKLEDKTYHQYITATAAQPMSWRPEIVRIAEQLRFDPANDAGGTPWLERARAVLAPTIDAGASIKMRLRATTDLPNVLAQPPPSLPSGKTIHAVKGLEFPGVCVVMTTTTAKSIVDFLTNVGSPDAAEEARKIYVAATRAERLLLIAAPQSQAGRLSAHLKKCGAVVEDIKIAGGETPAE